MNKLSNYADESIIIGGDFNCSLTELNKIGMKPVGNMGDNKRKKKRSSSPKAPQTEKAMNKLSNYADESIIIGGDFNCSLTELNKIGGKPVENKERVSDRR